MKSDTLRELAKAQDELYNLEHFIKNALDINKTKISNEEGIIRIELVDGYSTRQSNGKLPKIKFSEEEIVDIANFIVGITKKHLVSNLDKSKSNFKEELVKDL